MEQRFTRGFCSFSVAGGLVFLKFHFYLGGKNCFLFVSVRIQWLFGKISVTTMNQIIITHYFSIWLERLKNPVAKAAIVRRIKNAGKGNFGDHKLLAGGGGVYEMRVDCGKGYRVYYAQRGEAIYILLYGGDKSTQQGDIEKARALWAELKQTGGKDGIY